MSCGHPRPHRPQRRGVDDPFSILGVGPNSSEREIRAAFRRLAHRHHPDHAPGGDGEAFRRTEQAYREAMRCRSTSRWATQSVDPPASSGDAPSTATPADWVYEEPVPALRALRLNPVPEAPAVHVPRRRGVGWVIAGCVMVGLTGAAFANQPRADYASLWSVVSLACVSIGFARLKQTARERRAARARSDEAVAMHRAALAEHDATVATAGAQPRVRALIIEMADAAIAAGITLISPHDSGTAVCRAWFIAEQIPQWDRVVGVFAASVDGIGGPLETFWVTRTGLFVDRVRYEPHEAFWWFGQGRGGDAVRSEGTSVVLEGAGEVLRFTFARTPESSARGRAVTDAAHTLALLRSVIVGPG